MQRKTTKNGPLSTSSKSAKKLKAKKELKGTVQGSDLTKTDKDRQSKKYFQTTANGPLSNSSEPANKPKAKKKSKVKSGVAKADGDPQSKKGFRNIKAKAQDSLNNSSKAAKQAKAKKKSKVMTDTSFLTGQGSDVPKKGKDQQSKKGFRTTKANTNDAPLYVQHVFMSYKSAKGNKIPPIEKWHIPYIHFELSFKIKASKNIAAKAAHSTTNREEIRGPRTYISRGCESGYFAKKRKKAGACKAARQERFLSEKASRPSIFLSNHAIQRYRERGQNTFPIIKVDWNTSSAIVVTFLPKISLSLQHFKSTRDELLPFMQHGGHKKSKDLRTRNGKAPKEIESIFAYSKNAIKKIDVERRRRRREKAYKRTGYYPSQEIHFLRPMKKEDRFSKKAMKIKNKRSSKKKKKQKTKKVSDRTDSTRKKRQNTKKVSDRTDSTRKKRQNTKKVSDRTDSTRKGGPVKRVKKKKARTAKCPKKMSEFDIRNK